MITGSSSKIWKPRRTVIVPSFRSVKTNGNSSASATAYPMITPPRAGETILLAPASRSLAARVPRVLEQPRALHVAGVVQSGREAEVAGQQRAGLAQERWEVERHGARE